MILWSERNLENGIGTSNRWRLKPIKNVCLGANFEILCWIVFVRIEMSNDPWEHFCYIEIEISRHSNVSWFAHCSPRRPTCRHWFAARQFQDAIVSHPHRPPTKIVILSTLTHWNCHYFPSLIWIPRHLVKIRRVVHTTQLSHVSTVLEVAKDLFWRIWLFLAMCFGGFWCCPCHPRWFCRLSSSVVFSLPSVGVTMVFLDLNENCHDNDAKGVCKCCQTHSA